MTSLQTQSKAPDIPSPSLWSSKEDLPPSLNTQTQSPEIPGFSIRTAIAQYTTSLQTQVNAPPRSCMSSLKLLTIRVVYILMEFLVKLT